MSFCVPAGASESVYTSHFIPLQGFSLPLPPTLWFNASACRATPSLQVCVHSTGSMSHGTRTAGRAPPPGRPFRAVVLRRRMACKPGSVPRSRGAMAIHLGPRSPAATCGPPGRRAGGRPRALRPCRPYLTLLPVGLAVPPPSPGARWSLTPPFHPCRGGPRRSDLCGAFPGVRGCPLPRRALPGTVPPWSPDFPRAPWGTRGHPAIRRPSGTHAGGTGQGRQGQRAARRSRCAMPAAKGGSPQRAGQKRARKACQTASVAAHHSPLAGTP